MPISIVIKSPGGYWGPSYPELFPKWGFLSLYFQDHDAEAYTNAYHKQVLAHLNPTQVWAELNKYTLLCWEKPGQFCHRRLVAKWLEDALGVVVPEL